MRHPYKRDRRVTRSSNSVDTVSIVVTVSSAGMEHILPYEISLNEIPDTTYEDIVSYIITSLNGNQEVTAKFLITLELLNNTLGGFVMNELNTVIDDILNDIESYSTKEENMMETNTPPETIEEVRTSPPVDIEAVLEKIATLDVEIEKSLDNLQQGFKETRQSINKLVESHEGTSNFLREQRIRLEAQVSEIPPTKTTWLNVAAIAGIFAGIGYYLGKR